MNFAAAPVLVLGSANTDHVVRVPRLPLTGETLLATGYQIRPGGKGRNQAVAIARLGGRATLVAAVGDDAAGRAVRDELAAAGVDASRVVTAAGVPTGLALISIDLEGQNTIVVFPGANAALGRLPAEVLTDGGVPVLLCSLEVPLDVVADATAGARACGVTTVVNASPMPAGGDASLASILNAADVIIINESEAGALLSTPSGEIDDLIGLLAAWRSPHSSVVVLTLGARGAVVIGAGMPITVPAPVVTSTDTVGAGDVFAGTLALALAAGLEIGEAAALACSAGAIAVSRPAELTALRVFELASSPAG